MSSFPFMIFGLILLSPLILNSIFYLRNPVVLRGNYIRHGYLIFMNTSLALLGIMVLDAMGYSMLGVAGLVLVFLMIGVVYVSYRLFFLTGPHLVLAGVSVHDRDRLLEMLAAELSEYDIEILEGSPALFLQSVDRIVELQAQPHYYYPLNILIGWLHLTLRDDPSFDPIHITDEADEAILDKIQRRLDLTEVPDRYRRMKGLGGLAFVGAALILFWWFSDKAVVIANILPFFTVKNWMGKRFHQ